LPKVIHGLFTTQQEGCKMLLLGLGAIQGQEAGSGS
jgi:hypothetical protein